MFKKKKQMNFEAMCVNFRNESAIGSVERAKYYVKKVREIYGEAKVHELINSRNPSNGQTALHCVVSRDGAKQYTQELKDKTEMVKWLNVNGADFNAVDAQGETAETVGRTNRIKELLRNLQKCNEQLLHAVKSRKVLLVKNALGREDVNVNVTDEHGNTPLLLAIKFRKEISKKDPKLTELLDGYETCVDIANCLISGGANDLLRNNNGESIYDFALLIKGAACFNDPFTNIIMREFDKHPGFLGLSSTTTKRGFAVSANPLFYLLGKLNFKKLFPVIKNQDLSVAKKVLSLGCGNAMELIVLDRLFSVQGCKYEYVGIDTDQELVRELNKTYGKRKNISFHVVDATSKIKMDQVCRENQFDLGILRNGDFSLDNGRVDLFSKMIDKVFPRYLKDDAPLFGTFSTEEEKNMCLSVTKLGEYYYKPFSGNMAINPSPVMISSPKATNLVMPIDSISFVMALDRAKALFLEKNKNVQTDHDVFNIM